MHFFLLILRKVFKSWPFSTRWYKHREALLWKNSRNPQPLGHLRGGGARPHMKLPKANSVLPNPFQGILNCLRKSVSQHTWNQPPAHQLGSSGLIYWGSYKSPCSQEPRGWNSGAIQKKAGSGTEKGYPLCRGPLVPNWWQWFPRSYIQMKWSLCTHWRDLLIYKHSTAVLTKKQTKHHPHINQFTICTAPAWPSDSKHVGGILLSHKKKWNGGICNEVDGVRVCHTEWRKPEREKQIQYANTYIWNLKKKKKWSWGT